MGRIFRVQVAVAWARVVIQHAGTVKPMIRLHGFMKQFVVGVRYFVSAAQAPRKRDAYLILLVLSGAWLFASWHKDDTFSVASTSRYMSFVDKSGALGTSRELGCKGAESYGGVLVLAYGKQVAGGTRAFGEVTEHYSYKEILDFTLAYGEGLKGCSEHDWTVVVATSNYKFAKHTTARTWGKEWADMVNLLDEAGGSRIRYVGGIDLEPGWGDPEPSMQWLESYREYALAPLWSNASADGCPLKGAGICANGWSTSLMSKAVWDDGGVAVPQIYRTDGVQAAQWANLARINANAGGDPRFGAVMTQGRACRQRYNANCKILKNKPGDALKQLNTFIKSTGLSVRYATDIGWE